MAESREQRERRATLFNGAEDQLQAAVKKIMGKIIEHPEEGFSRLSEKELNLLRGNPKTIAELPYVRNLPTERDRREFVFSMASYGADGYGGVNWSYNGPAAFFSVEPDGRIAFQNKHHSFRSEPALELQQNREPPLRNGRKSPHEENNEESDELRARLRSYGAYIVDLDNIVAVEVLKRSSYEGAKHGMFNRLTTLSDDELLAVAYQASGYRSLDEMAAGCAPRFEGHIYRAVSATLTVPEGLALTTEQKKYMTDVMFEEWRNDKLKKLGDFITPPRAERLLSDIEEAIRQKMEPWINGPPLSVEEWYRKQSPEEEAASGETQNYADVPPLPKARAMLVSPPVAAKERQIAVTAPEGSATETIQGNLVRGYEATCHGQPTGITAERFQEVLDAAKRNFEHVDVKMEDGKSITTYTLPKGALPDGVCR